VRAHPGGLGRIGYLLKDNAPSKAGPALPNEFPSVVAVESVFIRVHLWLQL
jgi:hypothetical protein